MGYVKPKKIWKKRFSEEEIVQIWDIFKKYAPVTNWKGTSFEEVQQTHGNFVHPETDITDNSEGIHPKDLKAFLESFSLEEFDHMLAVLSMLNERGALNGFISDGFISWKTIWRDYINANFIDQQGTFNLKAGQFIVRFSNGFFGKFPNISNEVFEALGSLDISFDDIDAAEKNGLIPKDIRELSLDMLNTKAFYEKRADIWIAKKGRAPASEAMLRVNPDNFEKEIIDVVYVLFGTRQIANLQPKDQKAIALLTDNFGCNLLSIPPDIVKAGLSNLSSFDFGNEMVPDFRKELSKFFKDLPLDKLNLKITKDMLSTWKKSDHFRNFIMRKDKLTLKDFDLMNFINGTITQLENNKKKTSIMKTIEEISPDIWRVFYRYGVKDAYQIQQLFELFEANKNKKLNLPVFSGKVGSYSYEFIPKNDPRGLILGYATDCCQVIGGQGEQCLRTGFSNENSGFFLVEKDEHVYAQSWVWMKDSAKGKSLCFDSIEVLGKNLKKSKDILGCYQEASKRLVKEFDFDFVYAGADGNTMPEGLSEAGELMNEDDVYEYKLNCPFNHYTDINYGIVIFEEKGNK